MLGVLGCLVPLWPAGGATLPSDWVVVVQPFGGEADTARELTAAVTDQLALNNDLGCVVASDAEPAPASVRLNLRVVDASSGLYLASGSQIQRGPGAQADLLVEGEVKRDGEQLEATARCIERASRRVLAVSGPQHERDTHALAQDLAEVLHARLTGNAPVEAGLSDLKVRNDNSPVKLSVRFDREATGAYPVYRAGESPHLRLRSSEDGYLLLLSVSHDGVHQIYPAADTAAAAVKANQDLALPDDALTLDGDQPGYGRLELFYSAKPFGIKIPADLTATAYRLDFLPHRLRTGLSSLGAGWQGGEALYFYAGRDAQTWSTSLATRDGGRRAADKILIDSVVGSAPIKGDDIAGARDQAILDARRLALEAGLGAMISSETKVELGQLVKDTIDLKTQTGYVQVRSVLSERRVNNLYLVEISAAVSPAPIISRLEELDPEQVWQQLGRPRAIVALDESDDGKPAPGGPAESAVVDELLKRNVEVLDPQQLAALQDRDLVQALRGADEREARRAARELAVRLKADIVVRGTVVVTGGADTAANAEAVRDAAHAVLTPNRGQPGLLSHLIDALMAVPSRLTLNLHGVSRERAQAFVDALQPPNADLAERASGSEGSDRGLWPITSATLRDQTSDLISLEVTSPLRAARLIRWVEESMKMRGWAVTAQSGERLEVGPQMAMAPATTPAPSTASTTATAPNPAPAAQPTVSAPPPAPSTTYTPAPTQIPVPVPVATPYYVPVPYYIIWPPAPRVLWPAIRAPMFYLGRHHYRHRW
jgi:hypothetical protein